MFFWLGMVLVIIFVMCLFVVCELVLVMLSQGSQEDEVVILFGVFGWQMFCCVILLNICWVLFYGVVLINVCVIGEFGVVLVVFGLICGEILLLLLQIELLEQDYNIVGFFIVVVLLMLMVIIILFLKSMLQWCLENQEKCVQQEEYYEY